MVAPLSELTYRCPKCGGTFAAAGDAAAAAGCPSCREASDAGWYLKVRGQIVGPVTFEALPQQINASTVQVRQAGDADWVPVTSVMPTMPGGGSHPKIPADEFVNDFESRAEPRLPARRLFWPAAVFAVAVVSLTGGWVYHRVTLARAVESQQSGTESDTGQRGGSRISTAKSSPSPEELKQTVVQLEQRLSAADYRRQLLIEVIARQERKLAAQVQELKASSRFRRPRRFRGGFDPPDTDAGKTLLTDFRRRLALAWAATLAKRQDGATERAFKTAEVQRISRAIAKGPLQPHDEQLLKQNGIKYRTRYNALYTAAHKELSLYMEYATADEIALFAAHSQLAFPSGPLPSDFAEAVQKSGRK